MGGLCKKADAGLVVILILVIVVFFFGWLINVSQRECKSNRDCGSEAYCGSDFACHQYPTIQKTIVQYNLLIPSLIIGIAIVAATIIFNWNKIMTKETQKQAGEESTKNTGTKALEEAGVSEPYYKSGNIKTP